MMSNIEDKIPKAPDERNEEIHKHCQLLEHLEAEKAEENSKLQLAITARDAALAESQQVGHRQPLRGRNSQFRRLLLLLWKWNSLTSR
jgi:hypothetical protein